MRGDASSGMSIALADPALLYKPMTDRLAPQPWMTAPSTRAVIDALEAVGGADSARFVGGCVRDAFLKQPIGDIDIATPLTPEVVTKALIDAGLKTVPTGIEHGTVTAVADHRPFEITTLRRDVETDGRRAVVAFTTDWAEDAARRDFRLNALYLEPDGTLHDPTGDGIADARAGRIVFVGEAETRIREDYLRILRFFRFFAWFGKGEPDAAGLAACAALKDGAKSLSGERVSKELLKLLGADDPRPAVRLMAASGVLPALLPEAGALKRFETLLEIETDMLFESDPELRLAALLPDDRAAVTAAAQRLRLSNVQRDRLVAACSDGPTLVSWMSPREMRRAIYRLGAKAFKDRVKLAWAASDRPVTYTQWRMLYVYADAWRPPPFPLDGAEIMAAGVPEGPLIGRVRREVEDWWIDLDFTDDKMAVLERLKAVAQGLAY
jgi:poly(A) polymerase